ncbi:DUF4810 domain-containing protein [Azohydromonas australica]|uniref:DUF4810 domain-containing protein n=1 Tax=Azohydromonas australica TaxID=364039 RepID=UPI00041C411E
MSRLRTTGLAAALALAGLMAGCANRPASLYQWEGYQRQVYEHLKGEGATASDQLSLLEAQAEKARAGGAALPPGFRAHLGLLYLQLDRPDEARQALEAEKAAFPESAHYMDFLLKGFAARKS